MASVLYVVNNTTQSVDANGVINLGTIIHKNNQSQANVSGNNIVIKGTGYFNISVNLTYTASATGDVVTQVYVNGTPVTGAITTNTVATASTQSIRANINTEILKAYHCNDTIITIVNTGIAASYTNIAVRIKRDA